MISSKKMLALCATTLAGLSAVGTVPTAVNADTKGSTTITYESTSAPEKWSLSVPGTMKLDEGASATGPALLFTAKNTKVSIVKEDGADYTNPQDKTFTINGIMSNEGNLQGTKDSSKKVGLNVYIPNVGDSDEKIDKFNAYGISGSALKDHSVEATYKADGSQKAERYIKFYAATKALEENTTSGEILQTSVSWTAAEKNV